MPRKRESYGYENLPAASAVEDFERSAPRLKYGVVESKGEAD